MAEHAGKPKVRFAGFTETWEQRKLGEIGTSFDYGLNAAAKPFDGKNRYIRITDIDDNSRSFLQTDLTSPDTNLDQAKSSILQEGDIVFARTGASVGKTYIYNKNDGLVYFAGFLIRVRVKPEYNVDFVFQNTLTKNYAMFINITSQRSGQPGVNAQEYASFTFLTPTLPEQARIGAFFRHLDRLVALHQRKRGRLENIKKAMLEKMFPKNGADVPEVRFAGFTEAWEQRKFEKIAIRSSAMAVCSRSLPGVEYEDIISEQGILNKDIKTKRAVKIGIKFLPGDVLFGKLRPYLKNWLLPDFTGVAVGDFWVLQPSEIDSQYLYYLIQTPAFQEVSNQSTGTKMPRADWNLVANSMFFLPQNDDEQTCIGTFFRQLDRLITLHQRKVALLQNIKKACLEKMFV